MIRWRKTGKWKWKLAGFLGFFKTRLFLVWRTLLILRGKNLLWNNSSWDFEGIVDTMDPYLFFPDGNFSPHTYLTNIFGTQKMGAGVDKIFIFSKRSIREKFPLQNLGVAEVFFAWKCCLLFILTTFWNSSCKLSQHHLDRYDRGKKYLSWSNQ